MKILSFIVVIILSGCTLSNIDKMQENMFNSLSSGKSIYDGSEYVKVNGIRCSSSPVMFELYQDSKLSKNKMVIVTAGYINKIENIDDGESLHINIDGKFYSFKSLDYVTNYDNISYGQGLSMSYSNKKYMIPYEFIKNVANSNLFTAKIKLLNNTYIEGRCSNTTLNKYIEENNSIIAITQEDIDRGNKFSAVNGFKKFINAIDNNH